MGTWRRSSEQSELCALHSTGKSVEVFNIFTRHGGLLTMTWALEGASLRGVPFIIYFSSPARAAEEMNLLHGKHRFFFNKQTKKNSFWNTTASVFMNEWLMYKNSCPCFPDLAMSETIDCVRTTKTQVNKTREETPTGCRALVFPSDFLSFFVLLFTQKEISY